MYWLLLIIVVVIIIFLFTRQPTAVAIALPEEKKEIEQVVDPVKIELDSYYQSAKEKVDLDFPPKKIGCCPFSKPLSKDLPIANVPMCYASENKSYLS
jgi:hypothetical protein